MKFENIRTAKINDLDTIAEFNYKMALETENKILDMTVLRKGVESILLDPGKGTYFVYEHDNEIKGQLMITREWSDWRNGYFWWIQSVYVNKNHRGNNIFKCLYNYVRKLSEDDADSAGLRLYVEKENIKAQSVYTKMGMEKTDYLIYESDYSK